MRVIDKKLNVLNYQNVTRQFFFSYQYVKSNLGELQDIYTDRRIDSDKYKYKSIDRIYVEG